jgi:uncharacterized LabA/DUF88 family protein
MKTAILIDGGYFLRRFPACYPSKNRQDAKEVAKTAFELALTHLTERRGKPPYEVVIQYDLHRIFFYDCPPLTKKAHQPVSRRSIDFGKTPQAIFRQDLHDEIRCLRKMAIRLGHLSEQAEWILKEGRLQSLLSGQTNFKDLTDDDFRYDATQKGVDMRIGTDIATLAYKRNVDQIVLVAGDADFVPAAKLARREGLDFVLDPMWKAIHPSLNEHVDGIRSTSPKPLVKTTPGKLAIPNLLTP